MKCQFLLIYSVAEGGLIFISTFGFMVAIYAYKVLSIRNMLKKHFSIVCTFLLILTIPAHAQKFRFDIHTMAINNRIQVYNREMTLIDEKGFKGIRLSPAYGEGVAWIKTEKFANGIIEFDVRGNNEKQKSFVGFAFHGKNDSTFDAIYLRPFQFQEQNAELRKRSIQYISLPDFTWRILREKSPGKYESDIAPSPNPDSWVHVKILIKSKSVSAYINGAKEPSLAVEKVSDLVTGTIGFYVADVSGGDFANLRITKSK